MNADEIYKKYVLQEKPRTLHGTNAELIEGGGLGGPRQSGRTTRALQSLQYAPDSIYVVPNHQMVRTIEEMVEDLKLPKILVYSVCKYIDGRHIRGRRALNDEMVLFDHTVYEFGLTDSHFEQVIKINDRYRLVGYDVMFDVNNCKINRIPA
jgi:hypothetical protein